MRPSQSPQPEAPHVVHLTTVHPPFDNRIFFKECRSLADAGFRVSLIAPHVRDEVVDGISIRSIPRARNRRERVTSTMRAAYRLASGLAADVYHLHDPELLGISIPLRRRAVVIYDVHEDLPRQIRAKAWIPAGLRATAAWCAERTEWAAGCWLDGIVAATPVIASRFPAATTVVVRNFPRLDELRERAVPYCDREPLVAHASADIAAMRGAREMVDAIGRLPDNSSVRLQLIGSLKEPGLRDELARTPGWRRTDWLGWRSPAEVVPLLQRARVGLNLLHDLPNYRDALPTKMYEYMAAGLPIVASDFAEWRALYEPLGNTLFVDPQCPQQIAEAIGWLIDHPNEAERMGRRGREAVLRDFNWANEQQTLLDFYAGLITLPTPQATATRAA